MSFLKKAKQEGYNVVLLFFWLNSPNLAINRVRVRVKEGGHDISDDVIRRRYDGGLNNFFKLYKPIADNWMFINNSGEPYKVIAEGSLDKIETIYDKIWDRLNKQYNG